MIAAADSAPHSLPAERAVLGACLVDVDAYPRAATIVTPHDFFRRAHQQIFGHMTSLVRRGSPIDLVPLVEECRRSGIIDDVGGPAYISSLSDGVPRASNIEIYARTVAEKARIRRHHDELKRAAEALEREDRIGFLARLRQIVDDAPLDADDELLVEPLSAIVAREAATPPEALIRGLMWRASLPMWFGPPRSFKSLAKREVAVALASGRAPFHLSRLAVSEPVPVVYVTEEDAAGAVLEHLDAFSDGQASRGELPLYLSACKGITLDDPRTQDRLIRDVTMCGGRLVILEPLRSLTSCVDQGPRELQPFTKFSRRLIRETGATVLLGHHTVKSVAGHDGRKGIDRVSGGGLLSIADSPVEFERMDEERVTFTPRGFKFTATPAPFQLRLETAHGRVSRLVAEELAPPVSESQDAEARVLTIVAADPGLTSAAVVERAKGRRAAILEALRVLGREGRLEQQKVGQGTRWFPGGSSGSGNQWELLGTGSGNRSEPVPFQAVPAVPPCKGEPGGNR